MERSGAGLTEFAVSLTLVLRAKCCDVRSMKLRSAAHGLICGIAFLLGSIESTVSLAQAVPYPAMAPLARYLEASETDEIALARSAAPASISANADVLTLSKDGYKAAIKGTNGFVCLVERSWA